MIKILKQIFGSKPAAPKVSPGVQYDEFEIQPAPVKDTNGWRVAGFIVKEVDGNELKHEFHRADSCADHESAVALTIRKARQLIDEQGEQIFRQH